MQPLVKTTATRVVEAAGTWQSLGGGTAAEVGRRALAAGATAEAATAVAEVFARPEAPASAVDVVYPQYGGLTSSAASVMTLLRQAVALPDGRTEREERTLDVRLRRTGRTWTAHAVLVPSAQAPTRALTAEERSLLGNPNIRLPAAAVTDVRAGRLDRRIVAVLNRLGRQHTLEVTVLRSGHPRNVFDTSRMSNHTRGRAVDIWSIDGRLVVDPRTPRDLLERAMRAASAAGASEVGGPFDLNGRGAGYFTDQVHRDHLHLGTTPGRPPAGTD